MSVNCVALPHISVVIPLYNKGRDISCALSSVLGQTFVPKEVIVVDDGSTDDGPDVVRTFVSSGVRLLTQPNYGASVARNAGMKEAQGPFVAFLDADDWWESDHLEVIARLIVRFPEAALFSTAHSVKLNGAVYKARSSYGEGWTGLVDDFFTRYARGLALVNSSTACVRRDILLEHGGFPEGVHIGEDIVAWSTLALRYPVGHAEVFTAVYNRMESIRGEFRDRRETPGSLLFLAEAVNDPGVPGHRKVGIARLFRSIAFFTAAGFAVQGNYMGLSRILSFAWRRGERILATMVLVTGLTPRWVLRLGRLLRHRSPPDFSSGGI